ncbi:MAG TPA: G1 family glutamic endopeptidase [Candidatus Dormibacteraeota bacterium]
MTLRHTWPAIPLAVAALLLLVLLPAPSQPQHAPNRHTPGGSLNWAGQVATAGGDELRTVSATFLQPAVTCRPTETSYAIFWASLDGYGSRSVEQVGTEANCERGQAVYRAWYELVPQPPVYFDLPVRAGEKVAVSVAYDGSHYRLSLQNRTTGQGYSLTQPGSGERTSAEVVAEALTSRQGTRLPLAHFGSVSFTDVRVNGASIAQADPIPLDLVGPGGQPLAITSTAASSTVSISSPV